MGLSGFVESGRFSGGGVGQRSNNINQTCSLLNQYLKKNGNFEDLNLGFNRTFVQSDGAPTKTMDFLPMIENAGKMPVADQTGPEKAQMTIFYSGQVIVFDEFPADKVDEILALATGGNKNKFTCGMVPTAPPNLVTAPVAAAATVAPSFAVTNMVEDNNSPMSLAKINDLPIARKNSLARFLEKRKDRIIASSPYQMSSNKGDASSKAGLASRKPLGF